MALLGGRVRGGRFYGAWPRLDSDALDAGDDLKVATDYRQVLSEVIGRHVGHRMDAVFPDYRYPGPPGLRERLKFAPP